MEANRQRNSLTDKQVATLKKAEEKRRGYKICGRRKRMVNEICHNRPRVNREACGLHGGTAKRGFGHPSTTEGKFSLYAGMLAEKYDEYRLDKDHHSLRDHSALTDAMIAVKVSQLPAFELTRKWYATLLRHVKGAWRDDGTLTGSATMHIKAIRKLILDGAEHFQDPRELNDLLEMTRKLKESDSKMIMNKKMYVPIDEFSHLVMAMLTITAPYLRANTEKKLLADIEENILGGRSKGVAQA